MTRSSALADIAPNHVECNPGRRGQPEGEEKAKRILTGLEGMSLKQGLSGIPCTRNESETSEPAQTLAVFLTREAIRSMTGGSSPSVT
jgi:hypothetical protein